MPTYLITDSHTGRKLKLTGDSPPTDQEAEEEFLRLPPLDIPTATKLKKAYDDESEFQTWYADKAKKMGLNPNPDDPLHFYDYRAAYKAGAEPDKLDATGHWPSKFKKEGHPNMIVNGINTKTGEPIKKTSTTKGYIENIKDQYIHPIENLKRVGKVAGYGLAQSEAGLARTLDAATKLIVKGGQSVGIPLTRGGVFGQAADISQNAPPESWKPEGLGEKITAGAAATPLTLSKYALFRGAPLPMAMGTIGAIEGSDPTLGGPGGLAGAALTGSKEALLGAVLNRIGKLPKPASVPLSGAALGTVSAISGEKPEDVATSALLGAGLTGMMPGPKKATPEQTEIRFTNIIKEGIGKGLKPVGPKTLSKLNEYYNNAKTAVKTIINNKKDLSFTTPEGEIISGELPKTRYQLSEAIDSVKSKVFKEYDTLQQQAGAKGASVSVDPIISELENIAKNKTILAHKPEISKYANKKATLLKKYGAHTTQEAQDAIQMYNKDLENFYKNPSYDSAHKAGIDSIIANNMRVQLDAAIENAVGPGYQKLKNTYGALKTIEKDAVKGARMDLNKSPGGLLDFVSNTYTADQFIKSAFSLQPIHIATGIGAQLIKAYYKTLRNPNTHIKNMFNRADRLIQKNQSIPIENKDLLNLKSLEGQIRKGSENINEADIKSGRSLIDRSKIEEGADLRTGRVVPEITKEEEPIELGKPIFRKYPFLEEAGKITINTIDKKHPNLGLKFIEVNDKDFVFSKNFGRTKIIVPRDKFTYEYVEKLALQK